MNRAKPHNVEAFRQAARRRIPKAVFDFVDGAAEDEVTERDNRAAFERVRLLPRVLADFDTVDLTTSVCGIDLSVPFICGPTGFVGVVHPDGELAAAVAAADQGTAALMSSAATYSLEELAEGAPSVPWFQIYPARDRSLTESMLDRAKATGVPVLAVTVDVPTAGNRERDIVNGYTIQPRLTRANVASVVRHPRWAARLAREPRIFTKNFIGGTERVRFRDAVELVRRSTGKMTPKVDWNDLRWIRDRWSGPLLVKGVLHPDDARRAVDLGANGIIVSNHGGRQLDGVPAALDVLPSVIAAVGAETDVLLDGGVRRGTDIAKALALGAKACLIGRPWVYGLAAGGTKGVRAVLDILEAELTRTLTLLGCAAVSELGPQHVWLPSLPPRPHHRGDPGDRPVTRSIVRPGRDARGEHR